ncbi:HDOD domain-containing protein [Lysinibacillus sphaericus]|uniref:EAL domain-containing protein n=2 Tax=Lysinibacillus TaxID=400634 RepID=A0A2S0JX42_LYSSH|nr:MULTISPECIES: HDOD domain-containing protein [Lysinibacillus]AVK95534.1 EAL domain-containing protein [Lysinibacillus sphaericus]MCS1384347.1 HDOD domain-containing protein [Lysinibacillus sphaericus]MED4542812.1 HDOD domain-containing protein [Lysinibacillus sphaericus]TKI19470.1 HDOD domain-containing protein [Lysinibacillus sphaericus]TKI46299.1 HDOD domain-containing protein [Lysinibacillus tabacifolii]
MEVFIGRQPIFNLHEQVVAYELLYRNKNVNSFPDVDSDAATVDVLVNSFLSIGIEEVTKGKPCFVNFTENLLMSSIDEFLDPSQVVIEILEDVPLTPNLVKRVIELKSHGFKIALDDFILKGNVPIYDTLFPHIDLIKVDFLISSLVERMEIENMVKENFPHIKLLAEKVETQEQYRVAKHSGYEFFQGYFFEQPQIIKAMDIPANAIQYFHIISLLKEEEPNVHLLAENIERDISLTYKLLQMINNSSKRSKSKIRSIKQAILLLGLANLRKWIYLLALREFDGRADTDLFQELMQTSLFRAKVCEKLAKRNYKQNFSEYFLVGMFSLIDAILQRPMNVILQQLPFSEAITETILGGQTEMTPYLEFSIALGKLDWQRLEELAPQINIEMASIDLLYNEALEWAETSL